MRNEELAIIAAKRVEAETENGIHIEKGRIMSTDFILSKKVSFRDLLGGRLATFGIREHVSSDTSERSRRLTDGRNYLWVYLTEDGFVGCLSRYGDNSPGKILAAIRLRPTSSASTSRSTGDLTRRRNWTPPGNG